MAALLRDHLMSLHRLAGRMTAAQALEVGPLTVALAAACLNGSAAATPGGDGAVSFARLTVVKRAIEHNLDDPGLSVERIARMVGMSRTMLYQAFEPMGGVAAYVRERRLRRAMALLVDPRQRHRTIYGIAMACGFLNESAFGRAFRRRFGMSPRDARHGGVAVTPPPRTGGDLDRRYELWLNQLAA
jgi:AraC-like DNA-binding protein